METNDNAATDSNSNQQSQSQSDQTIQTASAEGNQSQNPNGQASGTDANDNPQGENGVPDWARKRFGELTAKRREAETRAQQAEARIRELEQATSSSDETLFPKGNVEDLAKQYAAQMFEQRQLSEKIDNVNRKGAELFQGEFDRSISNLEMAGVPVEFVKNVVSGVPEAAEVLHYLGRENNLNEAYRLANLNPIQQGVELARIAEKAKAAAIKKVSSAPAPITPVDGGAQADSIPDASANPAEWIKWREANKRKK